MIKSIIKRQNKTKIMSRSRKSYTNEIKLQALQYFDRSKSLAATAREFQVDKSMVHRWIQNRQLISNSDQRVCKIGSGRSAMHQELEEALYTWVINQRDKKIDLEYKMIRSAARNIAKKKKLNVEGFMFSNTWIQRFFKRFNLKSSCKTRQAEVNESTKTVISNVPSFDVIVCFNSCFIYFLIVYYFYQSIKETPKDVPSVSEEKINKLRNNKL